MKIKIFLNLQIYKSASFIESKSTMAEVLTPPIYSLTHCHGPAVIAQLSLLNCHCSTVIAQLSLLNCHCSTVIAQLGPGPVVPFGDYF
jgi:hypothetical protein